jgi:hypothetical protein
MEQIYNFIPVLYSSIYLFQRVLKAKFALLHLEQLLNPPSPSRQRIGFKREDEQS